MFNITGDYSGMVIFINKRPEIQMLLCICTCLRFKLNQSPFTILLISSEKVLSPLFEDSGSESSPSLLSEDEIKPKYKQREIQRDSFDC